MYFADLSNVCQVDRGEYVRAIGWLSAAHSFRIGKAPDEFVALLRECIRTAVQPLVIMGPHFCEFCALAGSEGVVGHRNVWVPSTDCVYVAPEMIVHYIQTHSYLPPDEFVAAVLACPEQESVEFLARMSRFSYWYKSAKGKGESP